MRSWLVGVMAKNDTKTEVDAPRGTGRTQLFPTFRSIDLGLNTCLSRLFKLREAKPLYIRGQVQL